MRHDKLVMKMLAIGTVLVAMIAASAFAIAGGALEFEAAKNTGTGLLLAVPLVGFPLDPVVMAIQKGYRNARMIADMVLPRIPVSKQKFGYLVYDKADDFSIPDNYVGRKGTPNKVEFKATRDTDECEGYGLEDDVPKDDIDNASGGKHDPIAQAAQGIANQNAIARERRVSSLVFTAGNYAAANKTQLAGDDQWNSGHADADAVADIMAGLDACVMRPTHLAIGRAGWSGLAQNPYILKAVNRNSGDAGIASRRAVADLFELEDIYVGEAWYNTAKKGKTASLSRLWGKHALLFYKDESMTSTESGITFGFTAEWGDPVGGKNWNNNIGLHGGYTVRGGEFLKEKIMANDIAYFIEDCVA